MLMFGFASKASMSSRLEPPAAWETALADKESEARFLIQDLAHANSGMAWKAGNIWGHDPLLSKRYAEFLAVSQGLPPEKGSPYLSFTRASPALAILRLKHILRDSPDHPVVTLPDGLPKALLVPRWTVLEGRDAVLRAMFQPGMDFRRTVILETDPFPTGTVPSPVVPGVTPGYARVLAETTDTIDIEAETAEPSILLVTDAWAPGWRASALDPGAGHEYRVMPADHVLRAVPLLPGRHRLRLEYAPSSFRVGAAVSLLSLAGFLILAFRPARRP
jgi:hypothetical protein